MAHELSVWLFANHVGTLSLIDGRLSFSYTPEWLARPGAMALSASLPLQAEPFNDRRSRPFFAGLLPEGQMRRLLARQFHISGQNDFALLDRIGGECAGAVTFLPPGQVLKINTSNSIQWLTEEEVAAILDELPHRPLLAGKEGLRLSLAGAQDKLPIIFDGKRFGLPANGVPSSHILKPAIQSVEDSVINEGFCLKLAAALQLNPAKAQICTIGDRSFLLVERYDRVVDQEGHRQRLHQEDFCQALGIAPEMKYQNEGGANLTQCFALLRQLTRPNAPQVLRLFDYVVFNALIGNHDAHAKNFSVVYQEKNTVLAPLYDSLSTAVYPQLTAKMAMKIGGKYMFREIQAHHWDEFSENAGMAKSAGRVRIMQLAQALPQAARKLQAAFIDNAVVARIVALLEQRCALTQQRLKESNGS